MAAQTAPAPLDAASTSEEILSALFPDSVVRTMRVITESSDVDPAIDVDTRSR